MEQAIDNRLWFLRAYSSEKKKFAWKTSGSKHNVLAGIHLGSLIGYGVQGQPLWPKGTQDKVQRAGASKAGRHDAFRNPSHRGVALEIQNGTILLLMIYNPQPAKPLMTATLLQAQYRYSTGSNRPSPPLRKYLAFSLSLHSPSRDGYDKLW